MTIEYAMYRGDEFIDIGTIDELADKYYKKRELLAYLSKESTHEKMENDDTQLLLYKIGNKKGEKNKGMPSKVRHIKFYKYYKEWIETYKVGQVRQVTLNKYWLVAKQIKKLAPTLDLGSMTRADVQKLINDYGKTHEYTTVLDFLHHIQAPLKDAVYEGWIAKDPTYRVHATSQIEHKTTREHYLESDQVTKLSKILEKDDTSKALACLVDLKTGLRYAELLGLTPKDINLKDMTLYVNKTWNYKINPGVFGPTKNKYSNRVITIDWQTAMILQKLMHDCKEDEPFFVKKLASQSGRIFNSVMNDFLKKACKEAKVPRISFHGLRHTHASLLISNGVSIQSVAKRLGHGNTETTQRVYIHLLDDLEQRDNNKMMTVLAGLGG